MSVLKWREKCLFVWPVDLLKHHHIIFSKSIFQCHTRKRCQKWIWFLAPLPNSQNQKCKISQPTSILKEKIQLSISEHFTQWTRLIMRFYIEDWRWVLKTKYIFGFTYRHNIFDTHPWDTRNCREITQGRMPMAAISTILWRIWFGKGRPFMKTPPSWLTRPWPESIKPKKVCWDYFFLRLKMLQKWTIMFLKMSKTIILKVRKFLRNYFRWRDETVYRWVAKAGNSGRVLEKRPPIVANNFFISYSQCVFFFHTSRSFTFFYNSNKVPKFSRLMVLIISNVAKWIKNARRYQTSLVFFSRTLFPR